MRIRKGDNCTYELTYNILLINQQVENKNNEIVYWGELYILFYYEKLKRIIANWIPFLMKLLFLIFMQVREPIKWRSTLFSLLNDISWLITYNFLLGRKCENRHKETLIDLTKDLFVP